MEVALTGPPRDGTQRPQAPESGRLLGASLACAALALVLYAATLAPTFGWGDSADLALRTVTGSGAGVRGSSRDYPLYRAIGQLFQAIPLGDVGTRANLGSAVLGAISVGLAAWLAGYTSRSVVGGCAAAASLAVSHTFWMLSVLAEVSTLHTALVLATFACAAVAHRTGARAALLGCGLFSGLTLAHHGSGLVLVATLLPTLVARGSAAGLTAAVVAWGLTSAPFWKHAVEQLQAGLPLLEALGLATPARSLLDPGIPREAARFLAYVAYNFLGPASLLGAWGLAIALRERWGELSAPLLWLLLFSVGGIRSAIADKFNIYVLVYPVVALLVGLASAQATARLGRRAGPTLVVVLGLAPPLGYALVATAAKTFGLDLIGAREAPYRDNDRYFLWPPKNGEVGARRYAEEALRAVAPGSVLVADWSLRRPIEAVQTLDRLRPDVEIVSAEQVLADGTMAEFVDRVPCPRRVYLAADTPPHYYQIEDLRRHHALRRARVVFEVLRDCSPRHL